MKKTNILYVSPFYPPDYAGGANLAHAIGRKLNTSYFSLEVLTKRYKKTFSSSEDIIDGIKVTRVANGGRSVFGKIYSLFFLTLGFLRNIAKQDIVHFIGIPNETFLLIIIAKIFRKKVICTMELLGDDDLSTIKNSFGGRIKIWVLNRIEYVAGLSEELLEVSVGYIPSSKLIELPNAIETEIFKPVSTSEKQELKNKLLNSPDKKIVYFSGALGKRKGVDLIVRYLEKYSEFLTSNNIIFVLSGPIEDTEFEDLVNKFHDSGLVIYTGTVDPDDIHLYYKAADIFLFPSRREGFGRVALEARATGLACICSDIGPMRQIFENGTDALLFESGNFVSMEEKLNMILNNPELEKKLAFNAKKFFNKKYSISFVVGLHEDLYKRVVI